MLKRPAQCERSHVEWGVAVLMCPTSLIQKYLLRPFRRQYTL